MASHIYLCILGVKKVNFGSIVDFPIEYMVISYEQLTNYRGNPVVEEQIELLG